MNAPTIGPTTPLISENIHPPTPDYSPWPKNSFLKVLESFWSQPQHPTFTWNFTPRRKSNEPPRPRINPYPGLRCTQVQQAILLSFPKTYLQTTLPTPRPSNFTTHPQPSSSNPCARQNLRPDP